MPRCSLLLDLHGSSGRSEAELPSCKVSPGVCMCADALICAGAPNRECRLARGAKALRPCEVAACAHCYDRGAKFGKYRAAEARGEALVEIDAAE